MEVEFKLFGSLTVKQFISLSGGIVIGVIIYFVGFPLVIALPLILFVVGVGFSMAFVTINAQPFDRWFGAFISALFTSQRYVWKKAPKTPKALNKNVKRPTQTNAARRKKKELGMTPILKVVQDRNIELDEDEKRELSRLDKYFEAEFDRQTMQKRSSPVGGKAKMKHKRVDIEEQNIAGGISAVGEGQTQVKVGKNQKVIYESVQNQPQRPIGGNDGDTEMLLEAKVREILEKQNHLNPYLQTKEVEEKEKRLRVEMKQLYNEVQELKAQN